MLKAITLTRFKCLHRWQNPHRQGLPRNTERNTTKRPVSKASFAALAAFCLQPSAFSLNHPKPGALASPLHGEAGTKLKQGQALRPLLEGKKMNNLSPGFYLSFYRGTPLDIIKTLSPSNK